MTLKICHFRPISRISLAKPRFLQDGTGKIPYFVAEHGIYLICYDQNIKRVGTKTVQWTRLTLVSKSLTDSSAPTFLRGFEPEPNPKTITKAQVFATKPFIQEN